jgi:hypothetical protein
MRLLKYYYFRLYSYYSKGDSVPFLSTFLVVFIFAFFNFLSLLALVAIISKEKFTLPVVEKGTGRLWPLLIVLPLFGLLIYLFKKKGYHDIILEEFRNETSRQKFLSKLFVILYFISSIALFVIALFLRERIAGY